MDTTDPAIQERIQQHVDDFKKQFCGPHFDVTEDDILRMATEVVQLEEDLPLLNEARQAVVIILRIEIEAALRFRAPTNNMYGKGAFADFTDAQRAQAIDFIESTAFRGAPHGDELVERLRSKHDCRWSERLDCFQIVRITHP